MLFVPFLRGICMLGIKKPNTSIEYCKSKEQKNPNFFLTACCMKVLAQVSVSFSDDVFSLPDCLET